MPITDLRHFIRTYDDSLDGSLCDRLISSFHSLSRFHERNGRGFRSGLEESGWTELNVTRLSDPGFLGLFRQKMDHALACYNSDVGLQIPVPVSSKWSDLILKRYRPGGEEQFQLHFDSIYDVSNRYLVFLWYLNDVSEGGATTFPQLGVEVAPRKGRLLMFPPYWLFQHAGQPPAAGDKYILSTYMLF